MSDDFKSEINLVAHEVGFDQLIKTVRSAQEEVDRLTKAGQLNEKQAQSWSKRINGLETAIKSQTGATNSQTTAVTKATQANQKLNGVLGETANHLPRLRYALYDVSTSLAFTGAAMLGLATASVGTAIKMDRQFADVVRTTGTYLDNTGVATANLRSEFDALFTSLPTNWTDLTQIGTLAGQLGVAQENVAEFTELVTKFAATTNVSVEQSATAFGRLTELLGLTQAEYEKLGSSILATGTSSVATESQIISVSSQIASMGNFAGFTADEVIGLSSSLAALGVQPELSRGTVTRLFTNITTAIAQGGDKLEEFGRIAGMTGQEFARAWGEDNSDALVALLQGLQQEGNGAITTLKGLGITASRDVPTILKLAQNWDLVGEQFAIANQGFEDGTALQEQYGVIAETVASKLTVLRNNLVAVAGSIGQSSSSLGPIIDFLTQMIQAFDKIVSHPVGQVVALLVVGLTALGGVLAIVSGLLARGTASMFAMATAANELAIANAQATFTFKTLAAQIAAIGPAGRVAAASITGIRYALISTGIGAALVAIGTAITALISAADQADPKLQAFKDSLEGAFETDTATYKETGEAFKVITREAPNAANATEELGKAVKNSSLEFVGLTTSSEDTTKALEDVVVAMGAVTDAAVRKRLSELLLSPGGDDLEQQRLNLENVQKGLELLGYTMEDVVAASKEGNFDFLKKLQSDAILATAGIQNTSTTVDQFGTSTLDAYDAVTEFAGGALTSAEVFAEMANAQLLASDAANVMGLENQEAAAGVDSLGDAVVDLTAGIFDAINAEYALIGATYDLGASLATNGLDFSETTTAGRANLAALIQAFDAASKAAGGDADLFASYVNQIISQLVQAGVQGVQALAPVQAALGAIAQSGGAANTVTDMIAMSQLSGQVAAGMRTTSAEMANTANNARKAAKEVRTLSDYVSDLSRVMGDAFDFRFGFQQARDETTSAIHDISESFADARQKVRDLNIEIQDIKATLSSLTADRGKLEYQLSVAQEYGDTLRANEILAELEKNAADTAKAQAELADKQRDATKASQDAQPTLTGNTDAAIEQREAVLDLVSTIQDQIAAYAATGASQKEIEAFARKLKEQLAAQLRAWGYNTAEIKKYTAGVQDFVQIIRQIPRNLTVRADADTNPAQKALNEFFAKNQNKTITTTQNVVQKIKPPSTADMKKSAIQGQINSINAQIVYWTKNGGNPNLLAALGRELQRLRTLLNGFSGGGYTGSGGKYTPAGIVHKGEYVIPKEHVNQATGLPYADAFNRIANGVQRPSGSYASGGFVMPGLLQVELSPYDRRLLERVGNAKIVMDGREVAAVVNGVNENAGARRG